MVRKMTNPFQYGGVVGEEAFCNRQTELAYGTDAIKKGDTIEIDFERGVVIHEGREYHFPALPKEVPRHLERRRPDPAREEGLGKGVASAGFRVLSTYERVEAQLSQSRQLARLRQVRPTAAFVVWEAELKRPRASFTEWPAQSGQTSVCRIMQR
jgi:hypothetical protein